MVKKIRGEDIKRFRKEVSRDIEDALEVLRWDRMKLAESYGNHIQEKSYTEARIGQLINVNRGEEENSERMLNWMNKQIEARKVTSGNR